MEVEILVQGKNETPKLRAINPPVMDFSNNEKITFCVIEGGMKSGEPSVMIISQDHRGTAVLQTSLDKFLLAASSMATSAEVGWGWERPEGHASIMPPDRQTRKFLLESIKKDLEEWDDVDGEGNVDG